MSCRVRHLLKMSQVALVPVAKAVQMLSTKALKGLNAGDESSERFHYWQRHPCNVNVSCSLSIVNISCSLSILLLAFAKTRLHPKPCIVAPPYRMTGPFDITRYHALSIS